MSRVFISVGSNMQPFVNFRKAILELNRHVEIRSISTVYLTDSVGGDEFPKYLNAVIEAETGHSHEKLRSDVLSQIERDLGRVRSDNAHIPRQIDLEILLYDAESKGNGKLYIPDRQKLNEPYIAVPLHEIAPDLKLPESDDSTEGIIAGMTPITMNPMRDFTDILWDWIRDETPATRQPVN